MLITRKSVMSGTTRTRNLNVTQEQLDKWNNGGLIQNVFSHLSREDREFLQTGMTQEEWDAVTSEELFEDDNDDGGEAF